jgi:hypothetical protein
VAQGQGQQPMIDVSQLVEMTAEVAANRAVEKVESKVSELAQDVAVVKNRLLGYNGTKGIITEFDEERQWTSKRFRDVYQRIEGSKTFADRLKGSWKVISIISLVAWEVFKEMHAK